MMIHKITPSVALDQWLKRFNTELNKPTNQNSLMFPKLLSQGIRNVKTLGTSVINNPLSPFLSDITWMLRISVGMY